MTPGSCNVHAYNLSCCQARSPSDALPAFWIPELLKSHPWKRMQSVCVLSNLSQHTVVAIVQDKPSAIYQTRSCRANIGATAWWKPRSGLHELCFFPGLSPHTMAAISTHEVLLSILPLIGSLMVACQSEALLILYLMQSSVSVPLYCDFAHTLRRVLVTDNAICCITGLPDDVARERCTEGRLQSAAHVPTPVARRRLGLGRIRRFTCGTGGRRP